MSLQKGLVGHWSMNSEDTDNGMIRDRSAYDNHGTLNGPTTGKTSIIGDSFEFDAQDDYVRVPSFNKFHFANGESFTVSAWILVSGRSNSFGMRIINDRGTGSGGSYSGWQFKVAADGNDGTTSGKWAFMDTAIDDNSGNYKEISIDGSGGASGSEYNMGEWYHAVLRYRSDNDLQTWVNGNIDADLNVGTYGSISNSLPVAIGASISNEGVEGENDQNFNGQISNTRIYNRALSQPEINQLYNKRTTVGGAVRAITAELYDTQTYYGSNSHPSNKTGLDEFFDTSNNGVSLEKKRVHNRPHIFWGSNSQGVGIGSVNPYPYYITTGDKDGYSWKIESSFVAPETGTYTFGIDSDDASDVLINGNVATSYYGAHGFSGNVNNHTGTVSLTQGNQYDFAARFEEGGGGDGIAVAWQKPSDSSLSKFPLNILSPIQT